jgi:trehalose 6-phosphate synthase
MSSQQPSLVVVSNRGPLTYKRDESGSLVPCRAGGGLVASIGPALAGSKATWIASGIDDDVVPTTEMDDITVHTLALPKSTYHQYYDVIANGTLWFLHHNLFDLTRRPRIDSHWWQAWHRYCDVNSAFAKAVSDIAPDNAIVLVHDYHLTMLGSQLKLLRPDLKTVHFHHIPFANRDTMAVIPEPALDRLLEGLASHDACGFHSERWAQNFTQCCQDHLGRIPNTFVSAAAADQQELKRVSKLEPTQIAKSHLDQLAGSRKLIVRVDRIELSKNLLRGFYAFDEMLRRYPRWRENVTFAAYLYPSRQSMAEYLGYRNEVEGLVDRINDQWATPNWLPISLSIQDDFPRSVAALMRYNVLLINPIRDGLNLVAKEGALLNQRNGAIVLSREAGSWHELSDGAIGINPFDIVGTSDALLHALEMSDDERNSRAQLLRNATLARTPQDWLEDQIKSVH